MPKAAKKAVKQPLVVTELELVAIETTRLQLQEARRRVAAAEASLDQQELSVMEKLRGGARVLGTRVATVVSELGPCRPKWHELFLKHMQDTHGFANALVEIEAKKLYPAKLTDVLVIGMRAPGERK